MATRYSSIFSGASTRPFATRFTIGVATCVAAVLVAGCNDPELEKQAAFERQFNAVAAEYAKTLGDRPDLLSANPTDESIAALRSVADRAKALSGGSAGQQAAARSLAASVYRTTASIEIARAAWLESGEEIVRGLAMSASGLAADLESVAAAAEGMDLSDARGAADGQKTDGSRAMRALQDSVRQLEGPANKLSADVSKGTARLSELGQEVAVLLRKARESSPSAGFALVEEAAAIKTEARKISRKTSDDSIDAESMMAQSRLVNSALRAAQGLQSSASAALDLLNGFEADIDGQAAKSREMAAGLRRAADTLMKSIADERAGALKAAYEAAASDLATSASDAEGDALRNTLTCEDLRMRVTQISGLGAQGRMLMSAAGDASGKTAAGLGELKSAAEAAITALKEKATAAAEQYANAGEDPATAGLKAYADGVKKMADGLTVDKLIMPPPIEVKVAAKPQGKNAGGASGRSMSGGASAGAADLETLIASLSSAGDNPITGSQILIDAIDDSTPAGKAMKSMMSASAKAMQPMMEAMMEKFGADSVSKIGAEGGGAGAGGIGNMTSAAKMTNLTKKSNDGQTAVYTTEDGKDITFVKTATGWKVDMLAGMDDAQVDQMEQMAPMMGMMIGPMKKAAESIAAKIRSGEIASADDVSAAMQMEVMKSLGGGGGGGGRRGQ